MNSQSQPSSNDNPYSAPAIVTEPVTKSTADSGLQQYNLVRKGLRVIYNGIAAAIIGFVISILLVVFVTTTNAGGSILLMAGLIYIFIFGCGIAILIGMGMCLGAPNENERLKMMVSLVCHIMSIVIAIGGGFVVGLLGMEEPSAYRGIQMAISILGQVLSMVGTIYFILFCKQVGSNIGNAKLNRSSITALRWFLAMGIGTLLMIGLPLVLNLTFDGMQSLGLVYALFGIFLMIAAIGTIFSQLAMIRNGIAALQSAQILYK